MDLRGWLEELGYGLNKEIDRLFEESFGFKGYVDAKVIRNFKIESDTKDQRVVAAFCLSPLYILESTSFLCTDNLKFWNVSLKREGMWNEKVD